MGEALQRLLLPRMPCVYVVGMEVSAVSRNTLIGYVDYSMRIVLEQVPQLSRDEP